MDATTPAPGRVLLAVVVTFLIMMLVPILPYGLLSAAAGLEPPGGEAAGAQFMAGVVVQKIGIALGFVLILVLARSALAGRWLHYAAAWFVMYAIVEAGQAVGPGYGWLDAAGGVVAEAIYFPLAAWAVDRILSPGSG